MAGENKMKRNVREIKMWKMSKNRAEKKNKREKFKMNERTKEHLIKRANVWKIAMPKNKFRLVNRTFHLTSHNSVKLHGALDFECGEIRNRCEMMCEM